MRPFLTRPAEAHPQVLIIAPSFGQYEIRRLIGKGGMGEVYEAYDTKKGRAVALKLLTDNYADDEKFRERFLRESRAAAILQEPHVIPIHDWGEINGVLYIDMRLVQGQTLHEMLKTGSLEPRRTRSRPVEWCKSGRVSACGSVVATMP